MNSRREPRISVYAIFKEKELWLLIFLGVMYFYRPLFLGETFFFRDLYLHAVADKQLLVNLIRSGEVPLWNPYLLGGEPFLGNIAISGFYPFNLLFFLFPVVKAFNLNIVLHFLFSLGSAYAFARILHLLPLSSLIVGVIYGFCGCMLSTANLPGLWFNMPYLSLVVLFWHLFLLERKRQWLVLCVISGVLQALTGSPEPNAITMIFLLGWTLCYPYSRHSLFRRTSLWVVLGIFIVGIVSIMTVPTLEMLLHSGRQESIGEQAFSWFSLHPKRLLEMVFPWFLGDVNAIRPQTRYWGWQLVEGYTPLFLNLYFGWTTVFLAGLGAFGKGNDATLSDFPRRVRVYCLLFAGCCVLLALGRFLPFFLALYPYIPFHSLFRSPVKLVIGSILPIALLAGYAFEVYFYRLRKISKTSHAFLKVSLLPCRRFLYILGGLSFFLSILAAMFWFSGTLTTWFGRNFFTYVDGEKNAEWGLKTSFLHAATVFLLATLLFYYRQFSTRRWQHWLFVCILVVDLLVAGKRINFYAPEDFFTDVPDIVPIIRSAIDDGRLFRPKVPPNFVLQTPSDEAMWLSRWNLEMLSEYSGYFYHVPIIFHSDANNLGQSYIIRLAHILEELPWSRKLPILSAGAVTLILTSEKLLLSEIEFIQEIPNRSNLRLYLYRNTRAAPRIGFVTNWDVVHSDDDALKKLLASNFNPRRQAILQADHRREFQAIVRTPHERSATSGDNEGDMVKINKLHATNHSSSFSISTAQDGYLVFSEPFYPGWHVSVDGESVPILRANLAFSAIFLSAGEHVIERWYRPDSLLIGILISLFFCCLLGFVTYKAWW